MNKIKFSIIFLFYISISLSQNFNSNFWQGISVSTSDNLNALNLNPAGLGVKRANQLGFAIKEIDTNGNGNKYYISLSRRYRCGFAIENFYKEQYSMSVGYGFSPYNNIYLGFKYNKETDYSIGFLVRPHNGFSIGYTKFNNKNNDYEYHRAGIAIRPFAFLKNNMYKHDDKFIKYSNLTVGYDNSRDILNKTNLEQYFISFSLTKGIEFSLFTVEDFTLN